MIEILKTLISNIKFKTDGLQNSVTNLFSITTEQSESIENIEGDITNINEELVDITSYPGVVNITYSNLNPNTMSISVDEPIGDSSTEYELVVKNVNDGSVQAGSFVWGDDYNCVFTMTGPIQVPFLVVVVRK
jgi:hypothetical protein